MKIKNNLKRCTLALALITGVALSGRASAGIQHFVYVHNNTGKILEVQVNGRYRGVLDPGAIDSYKVEDALDKVTELYAEEIATGTYWSTSVSSPYWDYHWYVN